MNFLKLKSILFSLMAVVMLSVFLTSCEEDVINNPKVEEVIETEPTVQELTKDSPILLSLKKSEDVKNFNTEVGELIWEMAALHTFEDGQSQPVVIVPIENKVESQTISMLIATYNEKENRFITIVSNMDLSESIDLEQGYNGTMKYKTVENEDFLITKYENGNVVSKEEFAIADLSYRGLDFKCFIKCFGPLAWGAATGGGMSSFCINAYYGCIPFPSGWNPYCVSLGGCAAYMAGSAGYCAWKCWD